MKRPFWRQFIKGLSNVWNECLVSIYVFVCCLIDWYIVIYSFVTYSRIIQSYRDVSASGRLQDLYRHLLMPTAFTIDWLNRLLAVSAIFQPFKGRIKLQPLKRPELISTMPYLLWWPLIRDLFTWSHPNPKIPIWSKGNLSLYQYF